MGEWAIGLSAYGRVRVALWELKKSHTKKKGRWPSLQCYSRSYNITSAYLNCGSGRVYSTKSSSTSGPRYLAAVGDRGVIVRVLAVL